MQYNFYSLNFIYNLLTHYGTNNIIVMLAISLAMGFFAYFSDNIILTYILGFAGTVLALFTLWFFRDPNRILPNEFAGSEYVISPADGEVMMLVEEEEKHFMKSDCKRISIFLSPFDVHVNRHPVSGNIEMAEHHSGKFLAAYKPKSSELNEHSRIGVATDFGRVFFKQIVGVAARRIVFDIKAGEKAKAGEKFGMMKFGSRMDISIPKNSEILVKIGDVVKGSITPIAILKK